MIEKKQVNVSYPDLNLWKKPNLGKPENIKTHYKLPGQGKWKNNLKDWITKKKTEQDRRDQKGEGDYIPLPHLNCTGGFIVRDISTFPQDFVGSIEGASFTVWNDGDYPSYTCYVEIYEGPVGYSHPLIDYELKDRKIISLYPGERRTIERKFGNKIKNGSIVGIVFDPIKDPKDFVSVERFNRHIKSMDWITQMELRDVRVQ